MYFTMGAALTTTSFSRMIPEHMCGAVICASIRASSLFSERRAGDLAVVLKHGREAARVIVLETENFAVRRVVRVEPQCRL